MACKTTATAAPLYATNFRRLLKRASARRRSGEWARRRLRRARGGVVVGRSFKATAVPARASWMRTLAFGHHGDRMPTTRSPDSTNIEILHDFFTWLHCVSAASNSVPRGLHPQP